ncbi:MAG: SIR2 family protein [Candidatus Methanoperedens sp.]
MDVVKEVKELKTQLAYSKNIGFFFGAGTSCALDIPNIEMLTAGIEKKLTNDNLKNFKIIRDNLKASTGKNVNIEELLNHIRRIREITNEKPDQDFIKVSGEAAKNLDKEICNQIHGIIAESEGKADLTNPIKFFAWLNILNREYSKEVFTTNYDLIIEKSLEASQIPYFDGFVGSYEPFFWQESIEQSAGKTDMTKNWIRLWKIHGSLSWFWKQNPSDNSHKIIRVGKFDSATAIDKELVIYPSKEKYDSSRKQPFIAYFDRLKSFLSSGELLFIFSGYSFSDQHINDIIFNCLRQNNRLFCIVLCFKDSEVVNLHKLTASSYMNLNVFGPKKAIVNGTIGDWQFNKDEIKDTEKWDSYWDEGKNEFKLGDFNQLVNFLITYSDKTELLDTLKK